MSGGLSPGLRRILRPSIGILALLALLAACGDDGPDAATAAPGDDEVEEAADEQRDPVTVGVISSYTGPFGIYGDPMELAMDLRLDADGNLAGDVPVEMVYEDDATDPAIAVQKATKLIEEDRASVVVCCVNAASTFAVAPLLADAGIPQIVPIANPLGLHENPNAFVAGPSVNYDAERMGTYAAETLGHETAVLMAMDMAYGQAVADAFTKGFTAAGGEVVKTIMTPFGTKDFGSFLSSVPRADMVFGGYAGADAIAFVNQYAQFGLKDRTPLLGHGPLITELILQAQGPSAEGAMSGFYYSSQLETADNTAFISALQGANDKIPPSHFTAGAWATGTVLLEAIADADDPSSGDSMREAIAAVQIEAPWGPMSFDPKTGYVFGPTYVYKAISDGGKLRHDIVDTIE